MVQDEIEPLQLFTTCQFVVPIEQTGDGLRQDTAHSCFRECLYPE